MNSTENAFFTLIIDYRLNRGWSRRECVLWPDRPLILPATPPYGIDIDETDYGLQSFLKQHAKTQELSYGIFSPPRCSQKLPSRVNRCCKGSRRWPGAQEAPSVHYSWLRDDWRNANRMPWSGDAPRCCFLQLCLLQWHLCPQIQFRQFC